MIPAQQMAAIPPFNLLVSSVSAKVPLVRELRKACNRVCTQSRIFGADLNPDCPARYFVDAFWQTPGSDSWQIDEFIASCRSRDIKAIIPTRDGELSFFSHFREQFKAAGINVMISPLDPLETCQDKLAFSQAVEQLAPEASISTSTNIDNLRFSPEEGTNYVVKERWGAGGQGLLRHADKDAAKNWGDKLNKPIFQTQIEGQEYSIDVYLDQTGKAKGALVRSRDVIVAGEAQITTSQNDPTIEGLCCRLAEQLGLRGHVVFQGIRDQRNKLRLFECNPRFGGASTLAIAAGLDSFYWFLLESLGADLQEYPYERSPTALRQVRFAEDKILEIEA